MPGPLPASPSKPCTSRAPVVPPQKSKLEGDKRRRRHSLLNETVTLTKKNQSNARARDPLFRPGVISFVAISLHLLLTLAIDTYEQKGVPSNEETKNTPTAIPPLPLLHTLIQIALLQRTDYRCAPADRFIPFPTSPPSSLHNEIRGPTSISSHWRIRPSPPPAERMNERTDGGAWWWLLSAPEHSHTSIASWSQQTNTHPYVYKCVYM